MLLRHCSLVLFLAFLSVTARAHPMPNSLLVMDVRAQDISAQLRLPVKELALALGRDLSSHPETLLALYQKEFAAYVLAHVRLLTADSVYWNVRVMSMRLDSSEQAATGPYQELTILLDLIPPAGIEPGSFMLYYDVIIHQLVTHKALVAIKSNNDQQSEVGVIGLDAVSNTIPPLPVNIEKDGAWKGFKAMLHLGMKHISEGTDHLLFLLVLLLPAPLLARNKKWAEFGGTRYSLLRLLKIITAFTIGHSITLLLGALSLVTIPAKPVEVLIALSILITAVHAIRPLFPGNEIYGAAGFGLVHGLAFAGIVRELNPGTLQLLGSVLGFNLGIELMQLFVILLIVPWLLLMSATPAYRYVRIGGAVFAIVASIAWLVERVSGQVNSASGWIQTIASAYRWIVLFIAILASLSYFFYNRKKQAQP